MVWWGVGGNKVHYGKCTSNESNRTGQLSREWQGCPINATAAGGGGGERRKGEGRMRCSYFAGYQFRIVISQLQVLQISAV